ncbi:YDG domain-containing protein [Saccharibacillus brassicae]|uniref:S-layer homology domain-containing protein n=1 Tax=Saccharibacillus brassicae TaxID=2583377 RepID=A0A4Y6UVH1_SACBS|nr:YDG domain-containing protein [Saccharibacillus brassicae]QDH20247.1 S-layer homology domain-containing protein [Saccharibacillus brassicae]
MIRMKTLVSTSLLAILLTASIPHARGAAQVSKTDIQGTWAESQISDWIDRGYVTGYDDGSFKPDNTISRAEFVALINRSYGFTETTPIAFRDIPASGWIHEEVAKAVKAGYVTGYSNGTFGANRPISRQEAAVVVTRLLKLEDADSPPIGLADAGSIDAWARDSVATVVANGIIRGYTAANGFKPRQPLTRAEAVVVLYRSVVVKESLADSPTTPPGPTIPAVPPTPTAPPLPPAPIPSVPNPNPAPPILPEPTFPSSPSTPSTPSTPSVIDRTAPALSGVKTGLLPLGDNVQAVSSETGTLYLVPVTTTASLANLNEAVEARLGVKTSAAAGTNASLPTGSLALGRYAVYAVDASGNVSAASGEITLGQKQLAVAMPTGLSAPKSYDGTASASVTVGALIGVIGTEAVTVTASAAYDDASVGAGKTVTVTYALSGADAGHYAAPVPYRTDKGIIAPAPLKIDKPNVSVVESSASNSEIRVTAGALAGTVAGETVTVSAEALYDLSAVGKARPLAIVYNLAGADAANYAAPAADTGYVVYVQSHPDMGTILDVIATAKMYDGSPLTDVWAGSRAGVPGGAGIYPGDDATVVGQGTYADAQVGTGKTLTVSYTVSGVDGPNYDSPASFVLDSGAITARPLTITAPVLTAKPYDGTLTAAVAPGTLTNVVAGDEVFVQASATYADPQVGTGKVVTVVYTLSGKDAGNYAAPASLTVNTGEILPGA